MHTNGTHRQWRSQGSRGGLDPYFATLSSTGCSILAPPPTPPPSLVKTELPLEH